MLCKKTIERGRLWHCCNLFAMVMADGLQLKGFHLWGPFFIFTQNSSVCVALLWNIRHAFAICLKHIHGMFATCSLSVCYIFAMQKYGFCAAKVWFLACKNPLFALQKYGFCFLNIVLLQIGRNVFRG